MRVTITGRHMELSEALKSHIEEKLDKLERFSMRIPEAHVTLDVEKYRHRAEIKLHVNHSVLTSKEESDDMYVSVDGAIDKVERMLRRHKTKYGRKREKVTIASPVSEDDDIEEIEDY